MSRAHGLPLVLSRTNGPNHLLTHRSLDEASLQDLIDRHPALLPINELEPSFGSPVAVCREFDTLHGPIDNLLMTPEGNLVLVEVKLWRNPEARRKVVAQALDYASCLFEMSYGDLEAGVIAARKRQGASADRLYDLFRISHDNPETEARFVDAVNTNLRKGRILILVVGDGIRSETERLAELFHAYGAAHFTFALLELALFDLPGGQDILVCPRTVAKTQMIQRGVFEIHDRQLVPSHVKRPDPKHPAPSRPSTITAEQFFESMDNIDPAITPALQSFIEQIAPLGVYPEFRSGLSFKWDSPTDRTVNLGIITRDGKLWTTQVAGALNADLGLYYAETLARAFEIGTAKYGGKNWYVVRDGKAPQIQSLIEHFPGWVDAIRSLQSRVRSIIGAQEGTKADRTEK